MTYSSQAHPLTSPNPSPTLPITHLATVIGEFSADTPVEGVNAALLHVLPEGASLLLTREGNLAVVRRRTLGHELVLEVFHQEPHRAWARIRRRYGVAPGRGLARYLLTADAAAPGTPTLYGVLDLVNLHIVERGIHRAEMIRRVEEANRDPDQFARLHEDDQALLAVVYR